MKLSEFEEYFEQGKEGRAFLLKVPAEEGLVLPDFVIVDGFDGEVLGISPHTNFRSDLVHKPYLDKRRIADLIK